MLLLGALREGRPAGPLAVMTLVEAVAAVVCEPGVHTTDPVILSATLQVHHMTAYLLLRDARQARGTRACCPLYCSAHCNNALCQSYSELGWLRTV